MAKNKVHRFGEVCRLLDVQPYVLRYWETEFPALSSGEENVTQRTYTEEDLAVVQRIKELLYNESFTLVGAKKKLQAELDEGQLKLSTAGADSNSESSGDAVEPEENGQTEASPGEGADDAGDEEPEQVKKAKKRSVSKKTGSKKKATKKKTTKKKAKASADEPADDRSSVDLAELEAILGDARALLEVLRG